MAHATAAPGSLGGDWPTYLGNPERTGFNPYERTIAPSNASQLRLVWSHQMNGSVFSAPVVDNRTVYVGSWDGYEYAFNTSNGALRWKTSLGTDVSCGWSSTMGISSVGTVWNGSLLLGGSTGYWYALNTTNGSVEWKTLIGAPANGYYDWASSLVYDGGLYIGVASCIDGPLVPGELIELNLTGNHSILHRFRTVPATESGGSIWSTPALDARNNTIWVTTGNDCECGDSQPYTNSVIGLNASDLSVLGSWRVPGTTGTDLDIGTTPTLITDANGTPLVVATDKNGYTYALNRSNVTTNGSWGPVWSYDSGATFASGAFDGHTLYLGGQIEALRPSDGAVLWSNSGGGAYGAPVVANGVLVDESGYTLEVRNASDGALLTNFSFAPGEGGDAPAAIADGRIYVGSGNFGGSGHLYAYGIPFGSNASGPLPGTAPYDAVFRSEVSGGEPPYTFHWDFGDGAVSNLSDPTHLYAAAGNYTVNVRIADAAGSNDTTNLTVVVLAPPPVLGAAITASRLSGDVPLTVAFYGTVLNGTHPPYTYTWTWGDGTPSDFGASVSHTYRALGNLTTRLTVVGTVGDTANTTVIIQTLDNLAVQLVPTPAIGLAPLVVNLTVAVAGGETPYLFGWGFGDGGSGASTVPWLQHTYSPGNYTPSVRVVDAAGAIVTATTHIQVAAPTPPPPLRAAVEASPAGAACLPTPRGLFVFSVTGVGGTPPYNFTWTFGDDSPAAYGASVTHAYLGPSGSFLVQLTARDAAGAESTNNSSVEVTLPSCTAPPVTSTGGGGSSDYEIAGIALVVLLLVAGAVYAVVRTRRRPTVPPARAGRPKR